MCVRLGWWAGLEGVGGELKELLFCFVNWLSCLSLSFIKGFWLAGIVGWLKNVPQELYHRYFFRLRIIFKDCKTLDLLMPLR